MQTNKSIKEQVDELKIVGVSGDNKPDGTYLGIPMELRVQRGDKVYIYERKCEREITDVEVPQELADELEAMAVRAWEIADRLGVEYLDIHTTGNGNRWGPLVLCRVSEDVRKLPQTVFEKRPDDGCQSMRD